MVYSSDEGEDPWGISNDDVSDETWFDGEEDATKLWLEVYTDKLVPIKGAGSCRLCSQTLSRHDFSCPVSLVHGMVFVNGMCGYVFVCVLIHSIHALYSVRHVGDA